MYNFDALRWQIEGDLTAVRAAANYLVGKGSFAVTTEPGETRARMYLSDTAYSKLSRKLETYGFTTNDD